MIRRPPRSTLDRSSAASDVYKRQAEVSEKIGTERRVDVHGRVDAGVHLLLDEGGVEAVSYTHLRAHETVLDLVCRLLLEKKKPATTNHATSSSRYHPTPNSVCYGY